MGDEVIVSTLAAPSGEELLTLIVPPQTNIAEDLSPLMHCWSFPKDGSKELSRSSWSDVSLSTSVESKRTIDEKMPQEKQNEKNGKMADVQKKINQVRKRSK
jgi:hypothetical protein